MARTIIRNTAVSGSIPTTLVQGELAINVTDGKLYYGSSSANIVKEFTGSGGGGGSTVSASYATTASYAFTSSYSINQVVSGSITNVDYIDFNTGSTVTQPIPGRLSWNNTDGTLDVGLKGGNVTLQIGQETVARVVNKTGGNLLEADYRVVRVRSVAEGGAQGQRLAVMLAQADNDANSATTLGLVTENIAVNQEGFITLSGQVRKINTTGTLQGETWVDGDVLYLSPTTPGHLTNIKPQAPQHTVIVGYVEYAHNNQGKIFVKVDNGYEIDELHNVRINTGSLTPGQLLVRSGSLWINSNQLTGSYGLTGSLTISGSVNISGSTNAFIQNGNSFGTTALLGTNDNQSLALETSGSTRMFISSSGNVGIGTSTPATSLQIAGGDILIDNNRGFFSKNTGGSSLSLLKFDTSNNTQIGSVFQGGGTILYATNEFIFYNYPSSTLTERMRINTSGNVGIGTTTPSARLDVSGSVNISGSGVQVPFQVSSGSTSLLFVSQSGNIGVGTSTPTNTLDIRSAGTGSLRISGSGGSQITLVRPTAGLTGFLRYVGTTMELGTAGSDSLNIYTGNVARLAIDTSGNIGIGTGAATLSARLGVRGSGATSATTTFLVQNSTPTNLLSINDAGQVAFTSPTMSLAASQSAFSISPIISASAVVGGQYYGVNITPTFFQTTGSQTETALRVAPTFSTSSAAATGGTNIIADFGSTSAGSQLTVTDVTSGSIYMVNDISGLPILEATSDWQFRIYDYPRVILQKSGSNIAISGSFSVNNNNATPVSENTLTLGTPLAGGTGEGGQLGLQAAGGSYTSASFLDTWQDQFRVLRGPNNGSNAGLMYMSLQTGNTQFVGAVTASAYSGLPNDYLYAIRSGSNQTVGANWISQDIIFNSTVVSKGISYNTGTGVASLTGGKVYRVTARLAWSAAATYLLQYSCYTSANTQIGPTVEIVQSPNASNNISDGTLEFIYAPATNTDIKIRTTANNTALSGEQVRADLNTQFIIQQIA